MLKTGILVLAIACAFSSPMASAQTWYPDATLITGMTDADVELLYKSTLEALDNAGDGSSTAWTNPETGTQGAITPLKTYQSNNTLCRLIRFESLAGDIPSRNTVSVCKGSDGNWTTAPSYTATTPSTGTTQQAEHCKNLSREIDALKGKPLRRSAAMDRYNAECKEMPASRGPVDFP